MIIKVSIIVSLFHYTILIFQDLQILIFAREVYFSSILDLICTRLYVIILLTILHSWYYAKNSIITLIGIKDKKEIPAICYQRNYLKKCYKNIKYRHKIFS